MKGNEEEVTGFMPNIGLLAEIEGDCLLKDVYTMPEPSDEDDSGGIDMTSEADQSFMSAEADPDMGSPSKEEIYEARLERFRENGWDSSVLTPPEGYSEDDERSDPSDDSDGSDDGGLGGVEK